MTAKLRMEAEQAAARNKKTPRYRVIAPGGKMTWFQKRPSALKRARKLAAESGQNVLFVDVFANERHRVTPSGRIIDGHSRRVGDAPEPHEGEDIAGRTTLDQYRVNRNWVLVSGSRCKVAGERGKVFVFDAYVVDGDREWIECREIEKVRGIEHVTKFRAFRPDRVRTAPGWNSSPVTQNA